jgi:hypothetical protein
MSSPPRDLKTGKVYYDLPERLETWIAPRVLFNGSIPRTFVNNSRSWHNSKGVESVALKVKQRPRSAKEFPSNLGEALGYCNKGKVTNSAK